MPLVDYASSDGEEGAAGEQSPVAQQPAPVMSMAIMSSAPDVTVIPVRALVE